MIGDWDSILFKEYLISLKDIKQSTIDNYVALVDRFVREVDDVTDLRKINDHIVNYCKRKRNYLLFFAIKHYLTFKVKPPGAAKELIANLQKPKIHDRLKTNREPLTENEMLEVINALKFEKHKIIALIQMTTGVRAGDVLRLSSWDSLSMETHDGINGLKLNIIGKGDKPNNVFIFDKTIIEIIIKYVTSSTNHPSYFFLEMPKRRTPHIDYSTEWALHKANYKIYWKDLKFACEAVGVDRKKFATHDFRRHFARKVWTKWKDVQILQDLLNHSNVNTTIRYLRTSETKNIEYSIELQK